MRLIALLFLVILQVEARAQFTPACDNALSDLRPACEGIRAQEPYEPPPEDLKDRAIKDMIYSKRQVFTKGMDEIRNKIAGTSDIHYRCLQSAELIKNQWALSTGYVAVCQKAINNCNDRCANQSLQAGVTDPRKTCDAWIKGTGPWTTANLEQFATYESSKAQCANSSDSGGAGTDDASSGN